MRQDKCPWDIAMLNAVLIQAFWVLLIIGATGVLVVYWLLYWVA